MPIIKHKAEGSYVIVNKGMLMDRTLSLRDRGMLSTLLSLKDDWKFSVAGMEQILPDRKTAINNSLNELEQRGYLTRKQGRGEGGVFGENVIEIYEIPLSPITENRQTEKPNTDNPLSAKPMSEKQTQLNNNRITN